MEEDDSMVNHLTKLQDLREKLLNIDEVIPYEDMVHLTLDSLPESYLGCLTSLKFFIEGQSQSSYLLGVGRTLVARRVIKENFLYSWW